MKAQRVLVLALGATLSSSAAATAQASLTGRTITELRAGDYVWPKFSPNGRLLAVSQVLADSAGENTQILILDMRRGVLDTLLSAKAAAKYAVYKAYVREFQWLSDTSLVAWIPDGDVGSTAVTFNVRTRRILHEEDHEGDGEDMPKMRVMTDFVAERYWTVIAEMEVANMDEFERMMQGPGGNQNSDDMKQLEKIMEGYHELVDHGRREVYKIEG